jgi:hypothetical protein
MLSCNSASTLPSVIVTAAMIHSSTGSCSPIASRASPGIGSSDGTSPSSLISAAKPTILGTKASMAAAGVVVPW